MAKTTNTLDHELAEELGLRVSPFVMTLKHLAPLTKVIQAFVFVFQKEGLTYYDKAEVWTETLGRRHKIARFILAPVVEQRLNQRVYRRWYVCDGQMLYPVQTAKVAALYEVFYFVTDPTPGYRTHPVFIGETQFIRKKPLMAMRCLQPGWSVRLDPNRPRRRCLPLQCVGT